jgi:glycosyltransferase involved in cell wall biosynthesis
MLTKIDIAVVIKCSDDLRVFRCIESIPKNVEIVCSITQNRFIEDKLKELNIPYCITPKGNLSVTTNAGINLTKANNIIIMDSDSYFGEGAVELLYEALKTCLVAKGRIVFLNNSFTSRIIADLRDYVNKQAVAYVPGLAFRKEIAKYIGGYFFNPKIPWAEDADFDYRIKEAGIKVKTIPEAIIYHDPVSLHHDLRAAFRIGTGKRFIVEFHKKYNEEDLLPTIKYFITGEFIQDWGEILKQKGLAVLFYNILWTTVYYIGYYFVRFTNIIKRIF